MEVVEGSGATRVHELDLAGQRVGWLTLAPTRLVVTENVRIVPMPTDPRTYANQLYKVLHDLDWAELDRIIVGLPPATDEWLAVRDRLLRAAR
jgi:L-threonylcarbamoyladenylate synthase